MSSYQPIPLRPEVQAFATLMELQLQANDHKGGWTHDTAADLLTRLYEEAAELRAAVTAHALARPNEQEAAMVRVGEEAADVGNFAMMVADVAKVLALFLPPRTDNDPGGATPYVWWLTPADVRLVYALVYEPIPKGSGITLPTYLCDGLHYFLGRAGCGRRWKSEAEFGDKETLVEFPEGSPLDDYRDNCGGIFVRERDLRYLDGLPGIVTTLKGELRRSLPAKYRQDPTIEEQLAAALSDMICTVGDTLNHGLTVAQYRSLETTAKEASALFRVLRARGFTYPDRDVPLDLPEPPVWDVLSAAQEVLGWYGDHAKSVKGKPAIEWGASAMRRLTETVETALHQRGQMPAEWVIDGPLATMYLEGEGVRVHDLKAAPAEFEAVAQRAKTCEVRRDDRPSRYRVGDILHLREWLDAPAAYSGRSCYRLVTHVVAGEWGLAPDHVCMSIIPLVPPTAPTAEETTPNE